MGTHFKSGLAVGQKGTAADLTLILKGTVSVTVAALAAAAEADVDVTVTGAQLGDNVVISPAADATAETGLMWNAWVSATDTVTIRMTNASGSGLTGSTADWAYTVISSATQSF